MDGNKKGITNKNFFRLFQGYTKLLSKPTPEYNLLLNHAYVKTDLKESANCHVYGTFVLDHISFVTFVNRTFADP